MSDYNIQMHEYNGSGYDNLYPKTKSNMVLDGDTNLETKLKYYSNENLLDNWYFVGGGSQHGDGQFPINQRGQTSYSGAGYGIDRWHCGVSDIGPLVTVGVKSIYIEGQFGQTIENERIPKNVVLTFSALVQGRAAFQLMKNTPPYTAYGTFEMDEVSSDYQLISFQAFVPDTETELLRVHIPTNDGVYIAAVKLEHGDTQTLAHQENGVWVLNEIPNFQQELAKCRRYYRKCGAGMMAISQPGLLVFTSPFDQPMRIAPVLTLDSTAIQVYDGTKDINITDASINAQTAVPDGIIVCAISGTFSSNLPDGTVVRYNMNDNFIAASSEL